MSGLYRFAKRAIDPIVQLNGEFLQNPSKRKINLVLGVYRTEDGRSHSFNSVLKAIEMLKAKRVFEYLPITGDPEYIEKSKTLYFGSNTQYAGVQSLSGTGALRLAGDLISQITDKKTIYVPNPTWDNHPAIFSSAGLVVRYYSYLLLRGQF